MQHTVCGFTKLLLVIGFAALTLGWYRDVGAVADPQGPPHPNHHIAALQTQLPEATPQDGESQGIPECMRLVTLPVHCTTTGGFVRPEDRVDVVSVFRDKATVVVGNVFVSTVHPSRRRFVCAVTLLMTHEQAHTLAEHLEPVWLEFHGDRPAKLGIVSEIRLKPLGADGRRRDVDAHHVLHLEAQAESESKSD